MHEICPDHGAGWRAPSGAGNRQVRPRRRSAGTLGVVLPLVLTACGSPTAPTPPTLSGTYALAASVANPREGMQCNASGTVEFMQRDVRFSGRAANRVVCSGLGTAFDREETTLIEGEFRGRSVEQFGFTILRAPCQGGGSASGDPARRLSGRVTCRFLIGDDLYVLEGTWEAEATAGPPAA